MGRRGLPAGARLAAAGRRLPRRPVRPPAHVHARPRRVCGHIGALRPRAERRGADRRPRAPGVRRCPARAGLTRHPRRHLRGARARQGDRNVDGVEWDSDRDRPGGRRRADRGALVAGHLLDQRAADHRHGADGAGLRQGEQGPRRRPLDRLAGDRALGPGPCGTRVRADPATHPRLERPDGVRAADRRNRPVRILPLLGDARAASGARPVAVPHPQLRRDELGDARRVRRADGRPVLPHALPAADGRLLATSGRARDDAGVRARCSCCRRGSARSQRPRGRGCRCRRVRSSPGSGCCC